MRSVLLEKLIDAAKAVLPLILLILLLQLALGEAGLQSAAHFLFGGALVIAGVMLLFAGVDLGILPMGRFAQVCKGHQVLTSVVCRRQDWRRRSGFNTAASSATLPVYVELRLTEHQS